MVNETLLNDFKNYLLTGKLKNRIAKIILFGSHAKNMAHQNSDIDILIVTLNGRDVETQLMDRVFDFMCEYKAPLEVMTASIEDLYLHPDYFLYNITSYGKEIYAMDKQLTKTHLIKDLIGLSEEYLQSAQEVLNLDRIRLSIDAAYNAAEFAAKGLILLKQDDLSGSHGGIVSILGNLYIKSNEITKKIGRKFNQSLQLRNAARYKPNANLKTEDAQAVIGLAETLIELLKSKIA